MLEDFSADTQTYERVTSLYTQVASEIKGGLDTIKQNSGTVTSFLPDVQIEDAGAHFVSTPGRLGGDDRRNAAEKSGQAKQEAPGRKEEPAQKEQQPQGSKGSEQNKQAQNCIDYSARGRDVMKKPTNWTPDRELKSTQAQEWNEAAQAGRNKPQKIKANGNYEVRFGDSLWGIAERIVKGRTGKPASPADTHAEMQRIVGLNADKLSSQSNWQMIKPGMILRLKANNECEVPGQAAEEQQNGTPKKGEQQKTEQQKTEQQKTEQQKTEQQKTEQQKTEQQKTERTETGDKGQKVTIDAQERVTKIDYPNGLQVKLEYAGNSKDISRATVKGNGEDVVMVKNGNEYKVIKDGRESKDTVQSIEIRKDGSAVVIGTRDFGGGAIIKGQKIVNTDGTTKDRMVG